MRHIFGPRATIAQNRNVMWDSALRAPHTDTVLKKRGSKTIGAPSRLWRSHCPGSSVVNCSVGPASSAHPCVCPRGTTSARQFRELVAVGIPHESHIGLKREASQECVKAAWCEECTFVGRAHRRMHGWLVVARRAATITTTSCTTIRRPTAAAASTVVARAVAAPVRLEVARRWPSILAVCREASSWLLSRTFRPVSTPVVLLVQVRVVEVTPVGVQR